MACKDSGEPGLAGQTVFLDLNNNGILDSGEPTAITNASGAFSFTGLLPALTVFAKFFWAGHPQRAVERAATR